MIFATFLIKYLWTRYEPDQYLCVPQGAAQPGARQPLHLVWSTVQYSTVQYSTVQYSTSHSTLAMPKLSRR